VGSGPTHVAITGASSGIGAALAHHYAGPGVTLALLARNRERLAQVAQECRTRGAVVETVIGDVADPEAMAAWIAACEARAPLDLLIANAGIGGFAALADGPGEAAGKTAAIMATNMLGVANCVAPLLPRMIARRAGQIAIVSSLAGLVGLPQAPGYSASKAALGAYGDALRRQALPHGVRVSVIYPGFVETPMSRGIPHRGLFLWSAERAAAHIAARLARGQGQIIFPWQLHIAVWAARALPHGFADAILMRTRRSG
jgi:short-subunit dehydrogenase